MDPPTSLITVAVLIGAYALGCLATGYYLVRFRTARDIRQLGSGSSGATNVSRVLGWQGFVITLLLDASKGALAVVVARRLHLEPWAVWATLLAVILGHVWPVQLRFRGGKGAGTYLGGLVMLDWRMAMFLVPLALLGCALTRQATLGGLIAIGLLPPLLWALGYSADAIAGSAALAALVLFAHRANIRQWRGQIRLDGGVSTE